MYQLLFKLDICKSRWSMLRKLAVALGFQKPQVIGADLSHTTIKLIALQKNTAQWAVQHYALSPLPDGAMYEADIHEESLVAETIRKTWEAGGFTSKKVAIAIPNSAAITKTIQLPAAIKADELEGQMAVEIGKHIPYNPDEVYFDYIKQPVDPDSNQMDVLLVAAEKKFVDKRIRVFEKAGLSVEYVDLTGYAVERAVEHLPLLPDSEADQLMGIVDIGASVTTLMVFQGERTVYTREQPFGGRLLTEAIMSHYGVSFEEAGKGKKQPPEAWSDYEAAVFRPFEENLIQEIRVALDFFYSSTEFEAMDCLRLAGATVQSEETVKRVEQALNIPTKLLNPVERLSTTRLSNVQPLHNDAPALLVAAGLAIRSATG